MSCTETMLWLGVVSAILYVAFYGVIYVVFLHY